MAIILASRSIVPPKEWIHDSNIRNKSNLNVTDMFKIHYFPIPNEWYDDSMINE